MVKVKYEQKKWFSIEKVRQFCIDFNLYTAGDNKAYSKMFAKCQEFSGTDEELAQIAWDIVDHSDSEELEDYGFESVYEIVAMIMSELSDRCICTRYIAVETEE